ncbi:beta-xylosidase/alpha-l-arabinosidase [Streptomonospora wellingtoniae]|uniref:Glycoside hydrolase family 3 N-terminal domain-containing protein n=1 Tax=Streptomonospora wellingtoniae TaxID=3075544 RepID=A0ABU2KTF8_9ACTN|nr:glycoside hydrolase family 3 N-terminal domain-containing protein [Streptomonospora sp. DSM 45055]MDT0302570.1 glycoside hydrolase family 3 N-terminal domain-containing protein [Streptomonospora sp. DSM 45055]
MSPHSNLAPWQDAARPAAERAGEVLRLMTLEEKVAQLYGVWVGADGSGEGVAPHQHDLAEAPPEWQRVIADGLGQLTRPFGTAPVDPAMGVQALANSQKEIAAANRFNIPAIAHEECLSGFAAWQATVYPTPLAWGASFDTDLVERMAAQIGTSMRRVGIHQGLAPVLDVSRDPRWGRTEETIGEDPYLVGTVATAYVRGLQSTGVVATLKHFAGYSASRAGRNLAPVSAGTREFADLLLPPFEMAVALGGAGSVMPSYTANDGVPATADPGLLTYLLREEWGFTGTVVSDYFAVSFLETLHGIAGSGAEAGAAALEAGVDVELPTLRNYGAPLLEAVREGRVSEEFVDRAALRVLTQKCELGLLDPDWTPFPAESAEAEGPGGDAAADVDIDLDPAEHRVLARRLAEESVVLLANPSGALPLAGGRRTAVVGPLADSTEAMLGCYSFPAHVGPSHPDIGIGIGVPTLLEGLRAELGGAELDHRRGCGVDDPDTSGIAEAAAAAAAAEVCVAVVGDRAGLFGRGTSGEGCDVADLALPGVQHELVEALLQTGTPLVLVVMSGRPYALGGLAERAAAVVQAFFPGEEGGPAVAGVLSGRVNPSGRLPLAVPRDGGGQPASYLAPALGRRSEVSSVDPSALYPFGHGLSYTSFEWTDFRVHGRPAGSGDPVATATDGSFTLGCTVRNTGARAGTEVVQLYLGDPVARVSRPVRGLTGYARVELEPGRERRVEFAVPADLAAYTAPDGRRIVEAGDLDLSLGSSCEELRHTVRVRLEGPTREVDHTRHLVSEVAVAD